jgi:hypothetical protein
MDEQIQQFMTQSFPLKLQRFFLVKRENIEDELCGYLDSLTAIRGRVTDWITISKFSIDQHQFANILEAHANSNGVCFEICKWTQFSDKLSISENVQFRIKELRFNGAVDLGYEVVENMAEGLGKNQSLKDMLESVWVTGCELERERVQEIFDNYGFKIREVCD